MCGINGIISNKNIPKIQERINKMNESLSHRGSDASGCYVINDAAVIGHRRLSILDLDVRANQPMQLELGKWIITYNGEVFNFKEIRTKLQNYYNFKTESDTEVLLAGIEFKGVDWLLKEAIGMFAFAAYNVESKEIFLARDRFGIKPLFYAVNDDILIFSSEIKGILNSGLVQPEFNIPAIDEYLANRYTREPFTFFKNIFQIKSSTYIHFDPHLRQGEIQYWSLPALNFSTTYDLSLLVERTDEQIREAFHRWFISDVKVGAYLSGGLDSSLTTAILAQYSTSQVDTYTIGFDSEGFNEFQYAKKVADLLQTNHKNILSNSQDYFKDWERLIYYKDAPLAVPNEIPLAQMSSELSKDITVVISGEGADELFGGYGKIFRSAFDFKNHVAKENDFYDYFISQYEYVSREIRNKYLVDKNNLRNYFDSQISFDFSKHVNEESIFRFFHHYHIQGLLQRVDMTTMQTSVEARPPFLDHKLIEYVYTQIPYELKIHWNNANAEKEATKLYSSQYSEILDTPKYILKKVAERYLPQDIIYRKKVGFPVPLAEWFPNLTEMADILKDASWFKQDLLHDLVKELKHNKRPGQLLWMFINVQLFYNKYFNKKWIW